MESSGLRGFTRRALPESLKTHAQTAHDVISSMMGIRQTLLSAVLFDVPPVCSPLVNELIADYQTGTGLRDHPYREAYIIVLLPGESTIGKQHDLLLLPLSRAGNPAVSVVDVEGKVLDMDWEAQDYFRIQEMCRFRVSERGRVSALCVVFSRT
ncbi:hypothetical protein CNMCM6936_001618 [Aspergillus lentulus]|uniref:Uncharacterized protein n=1 Tax=Aspergillus lentulus TaxID=293939 RepID=A0AAN6BNV0_ASPLE|nr:hypothetical protein CNMCM6069_004800 [Aspergillus lentulus]KAF4162799.1 hypothetical protein CNMCM6936_001618 [Aspergillus lentulus]KAF4203103.1 hypothetical protein CNMCM8927_009104 [Aspergillus lentulus]GFF69946.1 hypothetical protein IFM62136_07711 [Aspergillus lentulus]GFF70638.1 hypothetical protein IFM47457_02687 [Aspergillus lentulus]